MLREELASTEVLYQIGSHDRNPDIPVSLIKPFNHEKIRIKLSLGLMSGYRRFISRCENSPSRECAKDPPGNDPKQCHIHKGDGPKGSPLRSLV